MTSTLEKITKARTDAKEAVLLHARKVYADGIRRAAAKQEPTDEQTADMVEALEQLGFTDEQFAADVNVLAEIAALEAKAADVEALHLEAKRTQEVAAESGRTLYQRIHDLRIEHGQRCTAYHRAHARFADAYAAGERLAQLRIERPDLFPIAE